MTIYVTHLKRSDGTLWEGPRVDAESWDEAQESCRRLGEVLTDFEECILVGEFVEEIDYTHRTFRQLDS